jgi:hypothetical protein
VSAERTKFSGLRDSFDGQLRGLSLGLLSEITLVDVALPARNGVTLRKRCIGQQNEHQLVLLQRLGLKLPAITEFARM